MALEIGNLHPFLCGWPTQRCVHSMGLLKGVEINVNGLNFAMALVVFNILEAVDDYNIILGQPWL